MVETRRIDIFEYTANGCSIESIVVPMYTKDNNTDKDRIMKSKKIYEPRLNRKLIVTFSRTVADPENSDREIIQQLMLPYLVYNGQSVDIEQIRKDIVTVYGYSEEEAKTFNVSNITYWDQRNEKVHYNGYHRQDVQCEQRNEKVHYNGYHRQAD